LIRFDDPQLQRLDTDILLGGIREFIRQVSDHTETPPEMALMVALGAIATANMRKFEVEIEQGFRQPLNLYLCVVMSPGNRKSAVIRRIFEPVYAHEKLLCKANESAFRSTSSDHDIWDQQCTDMRRRISKENGDDTTTLKQELDHLLDSEPAGQSHVQTA